MNCPIKKVANYHPISVYTDEDIDYEKIMQEKVITALPIIDREQKIVNIHFLEKKIENKKQLNLPVIIMAGGKGSRLKPFTEILPKPLIPIGGKTITEHIISRFQEYGCTHFDIIVNYKKNLIKSYFQDNENHYDICFVEEPEFWGTAGGLKLIENRYNTSFFITNCDILVQTDYAQVIEYHKQNANLITIVCAKKKVVIPYGTIETDQTGQIISFREKPEFEFITNTGLYLVEPEFIEKIPEQTFIHITNVIQKCIEQGEKVGTYIIDEENWMDMGQLEELNRMKSKLENPD